MLRTPESHSQTRPQVLNGSPLVAFAVEIVVVGTGDRTERLQPQVLKAMRQRGIAVEVQDTVSLVTWSLQDGTPCLVLARLTLSFLCSPMPVLLSTSCATKAASLELCSFLRVEGLCSHL